MQEKLLKNLANRHGKRQSPRRESWGDRYPGAPSRWTRPDYVPKVTKQQFRGLSPYRPVTKEEIKAAWIGVVRLMDHFGGDRKLAQKVTGFSIHMIISRGYLTPDQALSCQRNIDTLPWNEYGLCPHIVDEVQWKAIRIRFRDRWREKRKASW